MARQVVVTTDKDRQGVFFGELVEESKDFVVLKNAHMAIYWSKATKGVLGLASIGPQEGSRISPQVPKIKLNGITSISDATPEAIKQWKMNLWS